MKETLRRILAGCLCVQISFLGMTFEGCASRQVTATPVPSEFTTSAGSKELLPLRQLLQKQYVELFDLAPMQEFTAAEIETQRKALQTGENFCVGRFKDHAKQYAKQIESAQKDLKVRTVSLNEGERKQVHCRIQNLELLRSEAQALANHAIPTAYDNLNAKLDVIQKWPALYKQTKQEIADGSYLNRRWSDVKDIGFREIAANQQDDIKKGQQAIEEMKRSGLLPPEVENKAIQEYVNSVAQRIAQKSDLKIPLHVSVIQSREINAFALPGGYLFIERGLLEAADDEAELAGVLAHEMAHDAARHASKLMKKATIAGIFYQAAQVAAMILTGGVAGIGTYYALQYGFYGLGFVLNLNLLGVSRDYEMEADQLGVQYAWNSGYDPSGFIRFFDKIATREGYVNGASWFRTHPPFYQRMVNTRREIVFMPPKADQIVQTSAFEQMKRELAPVTATASKEEIGRPSLKLTREEGCEAPAKLEYKPGQPIETLCSAPARTVNGSVK
ncbi:MAG TPA: M48 family metalloprotease [Candidatus Methylomirabilis sp.]|nr:M48 family metalloprotease [Candidatus Methylomirabilis sp.]